MRLIKKDFFCLILRLCMLCFRWSCHLFIWLDTNLCLFDERTKKITFYIIISESEYVCMFHVFCSYHTNYINSMEIKMLWRKQSLVELRSSKNYSEWKNTYRSFNYTYEMDPKIYLAHPLQFFDIFSGLVTCYSYSLNKIRNDLKIE